MSLCQTCKTYLYLQTYLPLCQTCKLFRCCIFVLFFISTTFSLCPPLVVCIHTLINVVRWDYFPCLSRLMSPSISCSNPKTCCNCNLQDELCNHWQLSVFVLLVDKSGEWRTLFETAVASTYANTTLVFLHSVLQWATTPYILCSVLDTLVSVHNSVLPSYSV